MQAYSARMESYVAPDVVKAVRRHSALVAFARQSGDWVLRCLRRPTVG